LSGSIWDHLDPRREAVEAALRRSLAGRDWPPTLAEAVAYSLLAPGKRLRPLLTVLACEAAGGGVEVALPAGCAVEMVHTYSLVHDDLPAMDDDDLRRGRPTCHKRFGEALAILAGDALLTLAFEVLAGSYGPRTAAVSCAELAAGAGAGGMVGGQVLDLEAERKIGATSSPSPRWGEGGRRAGGDLAALEDIHRRKTGALFRSALRLGVYAAQGERAEGISPEVLAAVDDFAASFGLAFQVTDDLLDAVGSAETAGKRVGKDAARGKLTYPGLLGVEASRRRATELGQDAVAAAGRLGPGGAPLAELARHVVSRDR
jgi:geranylgeranyl diphosphate synthase type II